MPIISISISSELYEQLDEFIEKGGYSSRSEAIRDSVRNLLSEFELRKFDKGKITATITVISERERQFIDERLMRLRHEYDEIVSANMHIHLGDNYCLEVFITKGEAEQILTFISKIRSIRGIQQVKYTMVPFIERLLKSENIVINARGEMT